MATDTQVFTEPRPEPRTPHAERVLASLLLPAAAIIREKGILGASVEDLVEAVGVTKGALYYHIRTKAGLLFWIHESVTNEGYERWLKAIDGTRDQPAVTTLQRMIEEHCAIVHDYRDCVAVISEEMKHLPEDMQQQIRQRRTDYQALLESVLRRGVDSEEFAVTSVHHTASVMIGTLNSIYRWYSPSGSMSVSELADAATQHLLCGLRD